MSEKRATGNGDMNAKPGPDGEANGPMGADGDGGGGDGAEASADDRAKAIATLQTMLDYAIVEGAELKLQTFVYLLYMARLELNEASGRRNAS